MIRQYTDIYNRLGAEIKRLNIDKSDKKQQEDQKTNHFLWAIKTEEWGHKVIAKSVGAGEEAWYHGWGKDMETDPWFGGPGEAVLSCLGAIDKSVTIVNYFQLLFTRNDDFFVFK